MPTAVYSLELSCGSVCFSSRQDEVSCYNERLPMRSFANNVVQLISNKTPQNLLDRRLLDSKQLNDQHLDGKLQKFTKIRIILNLPFLLA